MPVSAVPIDDSRAVQIVRGELAANAITRQDADPKAAHLSCDVPEHNVVVVQLHAEHRVRQGLDHLALEFNLVLLGHAVPHPVVPQLRKGVHSFLYTDSNYQRRRCEGPQVAWASARQRAGAPPVVRVLASSEARVWAGGALGSLLAGAGVLGSGVALGRAPPVSVLWPGSGLSFG